MKVAGVKYFYPVVAFVATILSLLALGIIYWNRSSLAVSEELKQKISERKIELAALQEKTEAQKQQDAINTQKQKNA